MKNTKLLQMIIAFVLTVCIIAPIGVFAATPSELGTKYLDVDESAWSLVWSDEFDSTSIDQTKWTFTVGGGGFGNNEEQYYTDSSDNAYIEDGSLVLNAIIESNGTENYTSAKLSSTESWTYGKYEFRAKLPEGTGLWPAIWMLPSDIDVYGGEWPICGEIDIMEYKGSEPNTVLGTLHYGNPWVYNTGYYYLSEDESFANEYHTFAVEWLPGEIRWYVDDTLYQIQQSWYSATSDETYDYPAPFDQDFYLMLNLAVGGYFPGDPDTSDWTSTKFYIDYVRVYEYTGELVESDSTFQTPNINLLDNPNFDTSIDGWSTWTENGSVFAIENNTLRADIYTTLPNTWSTQLYQNVTVYDTTSYKLSFRARSTTSRPITVGLEGANSTSLYSNTVTVTNDWAEYTTTFTPFSSYSDAKLLFFLGNVDDTSDTAHTIYFDDITLIPMPEEKVTDGDFVNGLTSWSTWTENGSTFTASDDNGCVATVYTTLPNTWSTQLYQNIDLTSAGTYQISFRAKSETARDVCVAIEKTGLTSPLDVTFSTTTDWTQFIYTFDTSTTIDDAKLVFMMGNVGSSADQANTIYIDNVSVYRIS